MRRAVFSYLASDLLQVSIDSEGYSLRIPYSKYLEICTNNNIESLPFIASNVYKLYQVSPETWLPSFSLDIDNNYNSISTLNITNNAILQLFDNFELFVKQSNQLQDPIYYPFGSAPAVNPKVSVTIEPPTSESSTTFFNQPVMRWNP